MKFRSLFLLFFLFFNSLYASKPLTIVYNTGTPPLKFTDDNKKANGMLIDIWRVWAKKNNIDVVFKELPWKETISSVKEGKAHIHAGIYYTKQRDEFLDYTSKPIYKNKNYFFYYKRIEKVNSKKDLLPFIIGIGNGYPNKFMKEEYPEFATRSYKNADEVSDAFIKGEVKVILSAMPTLMYHIKSNSIDKSNFKYSEDTFAYEKNYFGAVKEGNKELLDLINKGFENISDEELKEIEEKWTTNLDMNYLKDKDGKNIFSKEQRVYLSNKKEIKMCVDPHWLPFEEIKDKKHTGIVAQIHEHFKKELNIPIELVVTNTWAESLEKAKNKECDILSAAAITPSRLEYLNFTKPYLKFPQVLVTREKEKFIEDFNEITDKKIGVVKNSAVSDLLKLKYPEINLVPVKNLTEGLYKVSSGELYGFVNTSAAVNYTLVKKGMTNLKIASKAGIDYYLRVAVRKDDKELLNIFDKAILSLDEEWIKDLKSKWLHVKVDQVINYDLVWKILEGFGVILAVIIFFMVRQNRLKKEIELQKKAFEDIYQKSTDPILLVEDGKYIDCNEAAVKTLGYDSKEEFLGMHPSKLSPMLQSDGSSSFKKSNKLIEEANEKGFIHFEWIHTKANGEDFWVDVILTKININNKDIIHVVWRDIQKRKEIEDQLREQKEQLDKVLSLIPVPVMIVSKDTKDILFANNYAADIYKVTVDNLEGHKVDMIFTYDNQREEILDAVDKNGILVNYETTYKASDDSYIDALLSLIPINFQGEDANLGVITDVTHLKKIQSALEEESQKAKEAASAKSDFLAKMSHEIRTPMNAILGMLYLVEKTSLNPIQENYIFKANSAAKALLNIVDDILDISKIEAGKLTLEYKNFTFNDMLHEIMGIMSYKAEEKGLELLAYYDQSIPKIIKSDRFRIGQILNNLISNAIKFTDKGEVVVSTKVIKQEQNNITIMFCVKDSGIGISKSNQAKLFQDFSQGDDSITRKFGGTGLGLSISKKLTTMLNGRIWIEESIENVGTTFCFTIHCEFEDKVETKEYYFPEMVNNLKVLIIDDNEIAADVLKTMLLSFGFDIEIVNSGMEGYNKVVSKDYDIVFLDYKMPDLNGLETFKKIKTIKDKEIPKTIMVTAYSQNEIITEAKSLGIEGYLIKPASPSTLYDTIIDVLNPNEKRDKKDNELKSYESVDFHGIKVLLVEDNELNQDFAVELLESANIKVDIANDGIEALALIKNKVYDAVFMDIQMPNMDGLSASRHIRNMAKDDNYFANIPIIALSANALNEDKEKSNEAGMNEHISKPIIPKDLFGVLGKYIKCTYTDSLDPNRVDVSNLEESIDKRVLDVKEVLSRIDGNYETYTKLLKKFENKYKNVDKEIIHMIELEEYLEASKKVHEVKGVVGNLGAHKVFDILTLINQELKKDKSPYKATLEELSSSLKDVMDFISNNIDLKNVDSVEFDKDIVIEGLIFIKSNIEDDIMACSEKIEKLTPYLNGTIFEMKFNQAKDEFNEFDTDSMLVTLTDLIKEIKEL